MRQEFTLDAVKLWRLTFDTGTDQKASYQPPPGWLYSGGANQLNLQPPGISQAQVAITKVALKDAVPLDEKERKNLAEKVSQALPEGSQAVKIDSEQANALQIGGKDTYLIELSYSYFGENFCRYCLFLNLKEAQLQFQLTSREKDYKELSKAFQKSLYSWQHLETP